VPIKIFISLLCTTVVYTIVHYSSLYQHFSSIYTCLYSSWEFLIFKPGARPQPAETVGWRLAVGVRLVYWNFFTKSVCVFVCLYVCRYICLSVCTYVSKAFIAKCSLYTRNKDYTEQGGSHFHTINWCVCDWDQDVIKWSRGVFTMNQAIKTSENVAIKHISKLNLSTMRIY